MKKKPKDVENADGAGPPQDQASGGTDERLERLEKEKARIEQERDHLEAKLQRAMADLQNFRRRQLQELEDVRRRTLEGLAHELLPVLDNFKLALEAHEQQAQSGTIDAGSLLEGLKMVQILLGSALERHGLEKIPAEDRPFDPNLHEAVAVEPRADVSEGTVVQVLQDGYTIADRVIRPSKVMVSGPKADTGREEPPDTETRSDGQQ